MSAEEHDRAVALISHTPHLVASLLAGRLLDGGPAALGLAGQGVRDTTRIAAGRADLWTDILAANAGAVADVLEDVAADLAATIAALRGLDTGPGEPEGALADLTRMLQRGVDGRERITAGP
jgi:prephenate dehydrogenase